MRRTLQLSAPGSRVGDLLAGRAQTLEARRGDLFTDESTVYLEIAREADNDDGYVTESWYSVGGTIEIDPLPCPGDSVQMRVSGVQLSHEDGDDDSTLDGTIDATFDGTSDEPQQCPSADFWCK